MNPLSEMSLLCFKPTIPLKLQSENVFMLNQAFLTCPFLFFSFLFFSFLFFSFLLLPFLLLAVKYSQFLTHFVLGHYFLLVVSNVGPYLWKSWRFSQLCQRYGGCLLRGISRGWLGMGCELVIYGIAVNNFNRTSRPMLLSHKLSFTTHETNYIDHHDKSQY